MVGIQVDLNKLTPQAYTKYLQSAGKTTPKYDNMVRMVLLEVDSIENKLGLEKGSIIYRNNVLCYDGGNHEM